MGSRMLHFHSSYLIITRNVAIISCNLLFGLFRMHIFFSVMMVGYTNLSTICLKMDSMALNTDC